MAKKKKKKKHFLEEKKITSLVLFDQYCFSKKFKRVVQHDFQAILVLTQIILFSLSKNIFTEKVFFLPFSHVIV